MKELQTIPVKIELIVEALLEKMARDIVTMEMYEVMTATDYMIICTADSPPQMQALAENVGMRLKKYGTRPMSVQGTSNSRWVLMDYGDVIVHIFDEDCRRYYELEKLWLDAPRRMEPERINVLKGAKRV